MSLIGNALTSVVAPAAAKILEGVIENVAAQPTEQQQLAVARRALEATTIRVAADTLFRRTVEALKKAVKR